MAIVVPIVSEWNPKGVKQATSDIGKVQAGWAKASAGIRSAALPAAAALGIVGAAGYKAIQDASNLGETVNAINKTFGDASKTILDYGKTAAKTTGLSARAFQELATSTGSLFGNLGYSSDQAAKSTITLTERAADLASVFNTDVPSALDAINSGLRGESEPLRKYGINLNDAALKAEALAQGLYAGKGPLADTAKIRAAEALILKQSTKAAGDFADTSDSLANRQRVVRAQIENLSATLGSALLPIAEKVVNVFSDFVTYISKFAPKLKPVIDAAKQLFDVLFKGDFKGGPLSEDSKVVDAAFKLRKFARQAAAVVKQLFGVLFKGDFKGGPLSEDSPIIDAAFKIRTAVQQVVRFVRDKLIPVFGNLLVASFKNAIQVVKDLAAFLIKYRDWIIPLAAAVVAMVAAFKVYVTIMRIVRTVTAAWAAVQAVLNVVLAANPIGIIILAIVGLVAALVVAYKRSETFRNVVDKALRVVAGVFGWLKDRVVAALNWIRDNWDTIVLVFKNSPIGLYIRAVKAVFDWLKEKLGPFWKWIKEKWDGFIELVKKVLTWLRDNKTKIQDYITKPFITAFNLIAKAWNATVGGLSFKFPDWFKYLGGVASLLAGKEFTVPAAPTLEPRGDAYIGSSNAAEQRRASVVNNITVNGAIDPEMTGRQIVRLLDGYQTPRGGNMMAGVVL